MWRLQHSEQRSNGPFRMGERLLIAAVDGLGFPSRSPIERSFFFFFFFNVYILSNKLLEDFLAILSSVWFTVISCIAIYWNEFLVLLEEEFGNIPLFGKKRKRLAVISQETF